MPRALPDAILASVLRQLREDCGLSQKTLAGRVGMTTGAIGRIEQRRASPSWSTVVAIAAALGVSLVDLAELIEANSPVRRDR